MKTDKLRQTFASLPAEAQPAVMVLLRQIAHDLQSPVSALSMEAFSIQHLATELQGKPADVSTANALHAVKALNEISANVERAAGGILEYIGLMSRLDSESRGIPETKQQ